MSSAGRADGFRAVEQRPQGFEVLVVELLPVLCDLGRHVVAFEMLPEPLDGAEVGTVGRQDARDDVVAGEASALVPARFVKNQQDAIPLPCRNLAGHGVEERLEGFRVAVREDEAYQLAA